MKIAIAQINTCEGDFIQTANKMEKVALEAQELGAEFIVFPLPVLTGPLAGVLASTDEFLFDTLNTFANLANTLTIPALVPVASDIDDDSVYDVALVANGSVSPLRLASVIDEIVDDEQLPSIPSNFAPIAFSLGDLDFGIVFNQEGLSAYAESSADADVVIYLSGLGFDNDEVLSNLSPSITSGYFKTEAQRTDSWIMGIGGIGGYAEQVFSGGSFVMAPTGDLVYAAPLFEEDLSVVDINLDVPVASMDKVEVPEYDRVEYLTHAIDLAIKEFCIKQNKHKVVVPLYGDMSSACLVTLAARAQGFRNVVGVVPSFVVGDALEDALTLARKLDIDVEIPDLGDKYDVGLIPLFLAEFSQAIGGVILVTDDKTSLALEPDKHEVRCVRSYAPFGDVYKSDVLAMASKMSVIDKSILDRFDIPEVEGFPSTSDKTDLISQIDAILYLHIEQDEGVTSIATKQKNEVLTSSVIGKMRAGDYARRFMPIMPIVSSRTLAECEYPIGIAWSDRTRDDFDADEFKDLQQHLLNMMDDTSDNSQQLPINIETKIASNAHPGDLDDLLGHIMGALQTTMPDDDMVDGLNLFSNN